MIPLPASQAARSVEGALAPIILAVLTTYTDRQAETVDRVFYWSAPHPVVYAWGGGGPRYFHDVIDATENAITGLSAVGVSLERLPGEGFARQAVTLTLRDRRLTGTETLWKALRGRNLHGATLELAELLIDPSSSAQGPVRWQLSEPGTDHIVRFRGELDQVEGRQPDGRITLRVAQPEPELPLVELSDPAENDPRDLGAVLPLPVGPRARVRCGSVRVGWVTTLAAPIDDASTGVVGFTDLAGIDTSGGAVAVLIDGEEVLLDNADQAAGTAEITARGQGGTVAAEHRAGAVVSEILSEDVLVGVSSAPGCALRDLYIHDPGTGELIRVSQGLYTYDADSGRARITPQNLRTLATDAFRSSGVTQQPEFDSGGGITTAVRTYNPSQESTSVLPPGNDIVHWDFGASPPEFFLASGNRHAGRFTFTSGDLSGDGGLEVVKWRMKLRVAQDISPSGIAFDATVTNSGISGMGGDSKTASVGSSGGDVTEVLSPWRSPGGGTTLGTLVGKYLQVVADFASSGTGRGELREVAIEAEVVTSGSTGGDVERVQDVAIQAASVGFGLRFYADVDGPVVPYEFGGGYGFAEGSGWNLDGASQSDLGGAQRVGFAETLVEDFEDHTDFNLVLAGGATGSKAAAGDAVQGSSSLEITRSNASGQVLARRDLAAAEDWTGHYLVLACKAVPAGSLGSDYMRVALGSVSGFASHWKLWHFTPSQAGAWEYLVLDMDSLPAPDGQSGTGAYNPASTLAIDFGLATGITGSGDVARFDWMRLVPKAARAQKNDAGTPDLTATDSLYRLSLTVDGLANLDALVLEISDTAGTGTTPEAARREIAPDLAELSDGQAAQVEIAGTDLGAPSVSAVQTIAVDLTLAALGAASALTVLPVAPPIPTVDLDALEPALAASTRFAGTPGEPIENPADVLRWLLADFLGLGDAALGAHVDAAATALAGLKLAGNLLAPGHRLDEVLAGVARESRSWIFAVERAAGTVYQMVTPTAAGYAFGAAARTLQNLAELAESMPERRDVGNRLRAFYGYDPSRGVSEDAFGELAQASAAQNDTDLPDADFSDSEEAIGARRLPPLGLLLVQDQATAHDVLGFYAYHALREKAATWELPADHWESFDLEPGDLVELAPSWLAAPAKALVLGAVRELGATSVSLSLLEVE